MAISRQLQLYLWTNLWNYWKICIFSTPHKYDTVKILLFLVVACGALLWMFGMVYMATIMSEFQIHWGLTVTLFYLKHAWIMAKCMQPTLLTNRYAILK